MANMINIRVRDRAMENFTFRVNEKRIPMRTKIL